MLAVQVTLQIEVFSKIDEGAAIVPEKEYGLSKDARFVFESKNMSNRLGWSFLGVFCKGQAGG